MGFWYFLLLFVGLFLVIRALAKGTISLFKKLIFVPVGICMIGLALFMFQDGSAEIVDGLLKSLNINL